MVCIDRAAHAARRGRRAVGPRMGPRGRQGEGPRLALTGALVVLAMLLAACAGKPASSASAPADVQLNIVAAPDINPDRSGRPSPVLVHVYQLRDAGKFVSAEFDDVTTHADTTLGAALIDTQQTMVSPGATTVLRLRIDPQTRLLGVVAEYGDLSDSRWRTTSALPSGGWLSFSKTKTLSIRLDREAVSVVTRAAGKRS